MCGKQEDRIRCDKNHAPYRMNPLVLKRRGERCFCGYSGVGVFLKSRITKRTNSMEATSVVDYKCADGTV